LPKTFENKVALITGASSGIGAALSQVLADQGASLVLMARRSELLKELSEKIEKKGGKAIEAVGDVTQENDLEKTVELARAKFGKLDILIANAGFGVIGKFEKLSLEDYRKQFETNVFGLMRTVKAGLPALKESRGTLVLTGSVSSHISSPEASPYSMSKFAVRALAEALYVELAPAGISVVLISPGFVDSQIRRVDNQGKFRGEQKDPIPQWLQMSAENAAKAIAKAIRKKKREAVITFHGKAMVLLNRLFPWLAPWFFKKLGGRYRSRAASMNSSQPNA